MTITQTVEIPPSRWLSIEVPREVPTGLVILTFTPAPAVSASDSLSVEDVRQLLQKEMVEQGTNAVNVVAGDGWEAHARERYAES
jgi:hypothetical protein